MIIIPAVDIKDGKCVRLAQGKFDRVTQYADNPLDMALLWARKGAELIHIVDLDGSVAGRPRNADIILNIVENINVPVQIGGGIRDMETIRFYLDQGVSSVILGTTALKNQQIVREACTVFPGRIILGIDTLNGKVAVRGWTENTEKNAVDLARQYEPYGVKAIVYTDIERDGMGTGINMKATRELADSVSIPVIASGGVASIADVDNLMVVEGGSIFGVIIGRALYTGAVDLEEAISKTKKVTRT